MTHKITSISHPDLLLYDDVVKNIVSHLPVNQLSMVGNVCKTWRRLLETEEFWIFLMTRKGLPFVEEINSGHRNIFFNLYFRTISGEMIQECFGEVRDIPKLSKECYLSLLMYNDPFIPKNSPQQRIYRTFFLVINPAYVYRLYEKELFDLLNASNDPEDRPEICLNGKEMKIPFTIRNRKLLLDNLHPNCKIFTLFLFEESFSSSKKTALWMMREHGVYRMETYADQKRMIEEKGFQLAPIDIRLTSNIIWMRKTGSCPDKVERSVWTFTRTLNTVRRYDKTCPVSIGGKSLISLDYDFGEASREHPALPCLLVNAHPV